jgi:hypothetical protein
MPDTYVASKRLPGIPGPLGSEELLPADLKLIEGKFFVV